MTSLQPRAADDDILLTTGLSANKRPEIPAQLYCQLNSDALIPPVPVRTPFSPARDPPALLGYDVACPRFTALNGGATMRQSL